jgi:WhiB family transcriptional regulator, redox-sensing transcriptional regulator
VRAVVNQEHTVAERHQAMGLPTGSTHYELDLFEGPVACLTAPQLFFAEHPREIEQAKALCRDCPARAACLASALKRREPWGVWGGELLLHGRIIADKRARGRPPKVRAA